MLDLRRLTPVIAFALLVAACSTSTTTASHGASPSASLRPAATSSTASGPAGTPATGQTDTEWGRIWDVLPAGFPTFPGSTPSEEASTGPASAILAVDGDVAKAVVTTAEASLKTAGYRTDALSGPLEDGTYTLEMAGSAAGCRVMITAKPTGGVTTVTILYGSDCPAP
jgi:hypothetical protein